MPVMQCPVCGYDVDNPSDPCPSCGNRVQPTVTNQPAYPCQLKTKQYEGDSPGGISKKAIAAILCVFVIALGVCRT